MKYRTTVIRVVTQSHLTSRNENRYVTILITALKEPWNLRDGPELYPLVTFPFILLYFDRSNENINLISFFHVPSLSGLILAFFASFFTFRLLIIRATNGQLTVDVDVLIS